MLVMVAVGMRLVVALAVVDLLGSQCGAGASAAAGGGLPYCCKSGLELYFAEDENKTMVPNSLSLSIAPCIHTHRRQIIK